MVIVICITHLDFFTLTTARCILWLSFPSSPTPSNYGSNLFLFVEFFSHKILHYVRSSGKCKSKPPWTTTSHLLEWLSSKKWRDNTYWQACGEKITHVHCRWECKLVPPLWKTVWQFLNLTGTDKGTHKEIIKYVHILCEYYPAFWGEIMQSTTTWLNLKLDKPAQKHQFCVTSLAHGI